MDFMLQELRDPKNCLRLTQKERVAMNTTEPNSPKLRLLLVHALAHAFFPTLQLNKVDENTYHSLGDDLLKVDLYVLNDFAFLKFCYCIGTYHYRHNN